jgi:hypothetical protein
MTTLDVALDRLPKVELHCHIEGTMRPGTLVELARRNGVYLATSDPTELYRYYSLDGFLRVFWLVQSTLASGEDWARLHSRGQDQPRIKRCLKRYIARDLYRLLENGPRPLDNHRSVPWGRWVATC